MTTVKLDQRPKLEEKVAQLLVALNLGGEPDSTILRRYTAWRVLKEVPLGELPRLIRDLEGDIKARMRMSERIYFQTTCAADKIRLYHSALDALPAQLEKDGRNPGEGMTFAEFRRALNRCLLEAQPCPAIDLTAEPEKPAAKRKPAKRKKKKPAAKRTKKPFIPPTYEEVAAYAAQRGGKVNPKQFWDYFTADADNQWVDRDGKPVRSWKQKMITWETKGGHQPPAQEGTVGYGYNIVPTGPVTPPVHDIMAE